MNTKPKKSYGLIPLHLLAVSFFGLSLIATLTFIIPAPAPTFPLQRQLIGSIFGGICLLGILAGTSPSKCYKTMHFESCNRNSNKPIQRGAVETAMRFRGHHPSCGRFFSHVFTFRGGTYCAGCVGLVIGAVISLFGSFLYFFIGFHVGKSCVFVFWLGFVCVAVGLLQYNLPGLKKNVIHLSLNVTFVLGAFLLAVGIYELNGSLVVELYLLALIVFWILSRIFLSKLEHEKICASCNLKCGLLKQ